MNPKQWLRATVAQLDAVPQRERFALLAAGLALLVGLEFLVVLPMQTQRHVLVEASAASAQEQETLLAQLNEEQAREEQEMDKRLKNVGEALFGLGLSSGNVGTRGESLSFLLSRTLQDSDVELVSLEALEAEAVNLAPREGISGSVNAQAVAPAEGEQRTVLYRHRYLTGLQGQFTAVTKALEKLEANLKPLRIERVRMRANASGNVTAVIRWSTIGLEKSWLSL